VLLNIGVNDSIVGPMPDQSTWQTNMLVIIDAVRVEVGECADLCHALVGAEPRHRCGYRSRLGADLDHAAVRTCISGRMNGSS
jgi:hypothetical protein